MGAVPQFEHLGRLAAECDIKAARHPEFCATYKRMAAEYRRAQLASRAKYEHENEDQAAYLAALPARKGWYARVREWFGGAK